MERMERDRDITNTQRERDIYIYIYMEINCIWGRNIAKFRKENPLAD